MYKVLRMSLERFCTEHCRIAETLVGVNAERMTALELLFEDNKYDVAYAIAVVESAEDIIDYSGKYKGLLNVLNVISEKRGLDWNDNCNAWEQWEMDREGEDDDYTLEKANVFNTV